MKLTKKVLAVLLAALMVVVAAFAGCSASKSNDDSKEPSSSDAKTVKFGLITLHDENSTYDKNFIAAAKEAAEACGVELVQKNNIEEGQAAYEAAAELVDEGCNLILADSFGHEDYIIQAAKEFTDVQFLHATGTKAHTEKLSNYHNAFSAIYEGRYLAGVAAGEKLNQMIADKKITADQAKMGYVGAYTYAEVISGYTSFYLGAKSQCPSVTMEVKYTNSWASFDLEKECAEALIADGCVLIGQHADTTGAPTAAQAAGVPCVGYNVDMIETAPDSALTSSSNNWGVYYTYAVQCMVDGTEIATDWTSGLKDGAVLITPLNEKTVAEGTQEVVDEVESQIEDGSLHVFDTSTWTVDGKTLDTYEKNGVEYISDGYFHESEYGSAPAFDIIIDGIDSIVE